MTLVAVVVGGILAAVTVPPPVSGAEVDGVRASIAAAPTVFDHRRTRTMHYELAFAAGAEEERFAIVVEPPRFPGGEGSPFLDPPGLALPLSGPASPGLGQNVFATLSCSTYDVIHGADLTTFKRDVVAPPSTSSRLGVTFRVWRRDAPFPGQAVRPTFRLTPELVSPGADGPATISRELVLRPPPPKLSGPSGVRIVLRTAPATGRIGQRLPTYPRGQAIRVAVSTRPRLRRQLIDLRTMGPEDGSPRPVARVRTDGRGRARYRWQPRSRGRHQLFAYYRRQQAGVTSDRACPRALLLAG